jgi:hypothetical protein
MKKYNLKKQALLLVANIHGSGINSDYEIVEKSNRIEIYNCYACMDEIGSYDYDAQFKIVLYDNGEIKLRFMNCSSYFYRKYFEPIKEYLYQLIDADYSVSSYTERPYYLNNVVFLNN